MVAECTPDCDSDLRMTVPVLEAAQLLGVHYPAWGLSLPNLLLTACSPPATVTAALKLRSHACLILE